MRVVVEIGGRERRGRTCAEIFVADLLLKWNLGVILCAGGVQKSERSDEDEEEVEDGEEGVPPSTGSHLDKDAECVGKFANRMETQAFVYAVGMKKRKSERAAALQGRSEEDKDWVWWRRRGEVIFESGSISGNFFGEDHFQSSNWLHRCRRTAACGEKPCQDCQA